MVVLDGDYADDVGHDSVMWNVVTASPEERRRRTPGGVARRREIRPHDRLRACAADESRTLPDHGGPGEAASLSVDSFGKQLDSSSGQVTPTTLK
jgi:hypothetical protein